MSAIITDQIRILNAKNFRNGIVNTSNAYYTFVGVTNAYSHFVLQSEALVNHTKI